MTLASLLNERSGNQKVVCIGQKRFDMHFIQTRCGSYPENALEGGNGEKMTVVWTRVAVMVVMRNGRIQDAFCRQSRICTWVEGGV